MTNFSFHRFNLTLRWQLAADYKRQIIVTTVVTLILFLNFWIWNLAFKTSANEVSSIMENPETYSYFAASLFKILTFLGCLALMIGYNSAHSMPFMKTKTAHIAYLALPASTAEKYAVVQTRAFLLSLLEAILAFFVADGLQYAMTDMSTLGDFFSFDWVTFYKYDLGIDGSSNIVAALIWFSIVTVLLHSAWFTFCASVFRKHPFLFGILILMGSTAVINVILSSVSGAIVDFANWILGDVNNMTNIEFVDMLTSTLVWGIVGMLVISIIFWLISYFRMKKIEL